jgi:hypothetical protein
LLNWQEAKEELEKEIRAAEAEREAEKHSKKGVKKTDVKRQIQRDENFNRRKDELHNKQRSLESRKVGLLNDFIFPSMANLTMLLEVAAKGRFATNMFEEDVKALLLGQHRDKEQRVIERQGEED